MNNHWQHLESHSDASVNHILSTPDGGMMEARWVQRTEDYGIVYVSSHTGCAHSCRFCHLTATRQTMMAPATIDQYLEQLLQGLSTYQQRKNSGQIPAVKKFHVNFMARGEALSNPEILNNSKALFQGMRDIMTDVEPNAKQNFLVSTIIPDKLERDLEVILADQDVDLYYSLYSLNPAFRKRWLPKAMTGEAGLDLCQRYQQRTGKRVALHWAFIAGENDSDKDVDTILMAIEKRNLQCKFNLVRYNPHDQRHGVETNEERLQTLFDKIATAIGDKESRIVPRVGVDVKASCGMFMGEKTVKREA